MKYPIGIQTFDQVINGGFVYVDKTDLIYKLVQGKIYFLGRPRQFGKSLLISTLESYFMGNKEQFKGLAIETVHQLKQGKLQEFMDSLAAFLASIPYSVRRRNDEREYERYFGYTFYLLLRMLSCYLLFREKETSKGRADCVYETPNDVYIFEFKLDGSADEALQQIEDKGYA